MHGIFFFLSIGHLACTRRPQLFIAQWTSVPFCRGIECFRPGNPVRDSLFGNTAFAVTLVKLHSIACFVFVFEEDAAIDRYENKTKIEQSNVQMFRMLLIFLNKTELIFFVNKTLLDFLLAAEKLRVTLLLNTRQKFWHDKRRWSFLSFCQLKSFMDRSWNVRIWDYTMMALLFNFGTLASHDYMEKFFAMILGIFNSFFIGWIVDYRGSIMKEF